jgi:ring-1,2-phenylacetyl-CoA epoxidase subunit PaaC
MTSAALVRLFQFAHFDLQRLERLAASALPPLAALGARMAAEKRIHTEHADSWMVRLARGGADAHGRLQDALDRLTPAAITLFEETEGVATLAPAEIYSPLPDAFDRWHEQIRRVTNDASLRWSAAPLSREYCGGRRGRHTPAFVELFDEMTEVYRQEPEAAW